MANQVSQKSATTASCLSKSRLHRIPELDCLRGLAAVYVLLYHYTTRYDAKYGGGFSLIYHGELAVDFFFILSGFVIYLTLETQTSLWAFAQARFWRLYPPFILCLLVSTLGMLVWDLPDKNLNVVMVLANLTMVPTLFKQAAVDGVYWSLRIEVFFYLWIGLVYFNRNRLSVRRAAMIWLSLSFLHALGFMESSRLGRVLSNIFVLQFFPLFLIGICFYLLRQRTALRLEQWTLIIVSVIVYTLEFGWVRGMIVILFCGVFWLVIRQKLMWLNAKLLIILGFISYPLYLVHQNIGYIVIRELTALSVPYTVAATCAFATALVTAGAAGYVGDKILKNFKPRTPQPKPPPQPPVEAMVIGSGVSREN